ncbi:MAG: hypothetical protein ACXWLR_15250 [Myxococcales bacterium]
MRLCLLPLLLLLAACPEQSGLQCPPNTSIVGEYALTFTAAHPSGECIAADGGTDGGPLPLALDASFVKGVTLCVATASDGGPELQLVAPNNGLKKSGLLDDGGFHFTGAAVTQAQTACICDVNITETIDGNLLTGGPFALRPDGGLPVITGINATLVDLLTDAGGGSACTCALPCTVTYSLEGSTF